VRPARHTSSATHATSRSRCRHRMSLRPRTSLTWADALFNNLDYAGSGRKTRICGRIQ
jgi:hypothetical protein